MENVNLSVTTIGYFYLLFNCLVIFIKNIYTALQKFGNALEKWGFGRYHTSKHTSKLDPKHTSKLCKSYLERKQSIGLPNYPTSTQLSY